jgi:hypothetical protein
MNTNNDSLISFVIENCVTCCFMKCISADNTVIRSNDHAVMGTHETVFLNRRKLSDW